MLAVESRPDGKPLAALAWTSIVLLVGVLDYITGRELAFSIFYLIPVSLAAWRSGRRVAIAAALASGLSWFWCDAHFQHYSQPFFLYWNAGVRLGIFLVVAFAVSALRSAIQRQQELTEFVVHDLRSPVTNVSAALQLLEETSDEDVRPQLVTMASRSCRRLMRLVDSLTDLGRLESGKMPLHVQMVGVSTLVEEACNDVALWAEMEQVALVQEIAPGLGPVRADPDLARRVLENLLGNALKFSPAGSVVRVRAGPYGPNAIIFRVTDQGPGIPQEWASRAFDKYAQVLARKAGAPVGSGLGLTFCRMAIVGQEGQIWIEQRDEPGTTIAFTLPLASAGPVSADQPRSVPH
jgi:signal transduction histidine kinase